MNNAAIFGGMKLDFLLTVDWDYYKKFMSVNLDGALVCTRAVYRKMAKRGVDIRFLDLTATPEKMSHDKLKQKVTVKAGIESDLAKKIQKAIKDSKMKVQASIQGDTVRVTGAKRDDLQAAMALLKKTVTEAPLSFNNFRD